MDVTVWQTALAAEDQIIYGYGVVGSWLPESEQPAALNLLNTHRARRDRLAALITASGATAVAPEPAYSLPFRVHDATSARRLAGLLERRGATYAFKVVAASVALSDERKLGMTWLADSAANEVAWTGSTQALPGAPTAMG